MPKPSETISANRRDFLKMASLSSIGLALPAEAAALNNTPSQIICLSVDAHPAVASAANILKNRLGLKDDAIRTLTPAATPPDGAIYLTVGGPDLPVNQQPRSDGYTVSHGRCITIHGARPRSLLYAAGEPEHWLQARKAPFVRNPSFAIRNTSWHSDRPVAEQVATVGANLFTATLKATVSLSAIPEVFQQLPPALQKKLTDDGHAAKARNAQIVREFHDADVDVFALLPYGNNFEHWSPVLYEAALRAFPSAKGTPQPNSWEKAALCPSDPATWRIFDAFVQEWAEQTGADGLSATFWDAYGAFCQDVRCKKSGLDQFPNELFEFISHYAAVLKPMGQKLHLRTWSSGSPHWLGDEYVHAPGYGQFGLTHYALWERVIKETPADVLIQTKVYHSDCEPDPPFSPLLGHCSPHTEIVEYQMTGQTLGRHYFPASVVDHTARTLKQSLALIGPNGGAQMDAGGAMQPGYDVFADIINSANVYAWRQLTWDVNADVGDLWSAWATSIYGSAAASSISAFMRASEEAVYRCFSPLGHGSSTNSDFPSNIQRRETLLRYTNRYYLPEYAVFLDPTLDNIQRVKVEKEACLKNISLMASALEKARPHLSVQQAAELTTRFDWFQQFALCNVTLDLSLWRYRYLRSLAANQTTDPDQMKELAAAYDLIETTTPKLFQFDPKAQFSCYKVTLGDLTKRPNLGNPRSLMHQIYAESLRCVLDSIGPGKLPDAWLRGKLTDSIPPPNPIAKS